MLAAVGNHLGVGAVFSVEFVEEWVLLDHSRLISKFLVIVFFTDSLNVHSVGVDLSIEELFVLDVH